MQIVRAIYEDGVFEPAEKHDLRDGQEARLAVHLSEQITSEERARALKELFELADRTIFRAPDRLPTREELAS